jgi:hypothetical protein
MTARPADVGTIPAGRASAHRAAPARGLVRGRTIALLAIEIAGCAKPPDEGAAPAARHRMESAAVRTRC